MSCSSSSNFQSPVIYNRFSRGLKLSSFGLRFLRGTNSNPLIFHYLSSQSPKILSFMIVVLLLWIWLFSPFSDERSFEWKLGLQLSLRSRVTTYSGKIRAVNPDSGLNPSSPWDEKPFELRPSGRRAYLDEQDVVTLLDPPKELIPLDPSSYNPAAYLWWISFQLF